MTVIDCECSNQNVLILVGVYTDGNYFPFRTGDEAWEYIVENKIREVWCHNLEYDFFKMFDSITKFKLKFCGHYSTAGLSYLQVGCIIFKDLWNHLPFSLKAIGRLIGLKKLSIDYEKITKVTKKLIRYNRRDCEITYGALKGIEEIYLKEGCIKLKSTSGSQAMQIYLRRFFCANFKKVKARTINEWRNGYRGGWVECFKAGLFKKGTYYKIDINSIFPLMMRTSLPLYYSFKIVNSLTSFQRRSMYWLGVRKSIEEGRERIEVFNSVEHNKEECNYYYLFDKKVFPFRGFVDALYCKKANSKRLRKQVYKKLLTSLYGKFGQLDNSDMITNYNFKNSHSIYYKEQIINDLYRIKKTTKNKFWVNVIWSLFITAKARWFMLNLYKYLKRKGFDVYYVDTDAFIIKGDIEKIAGIIDVNRLGLFKVEDMSNEIDIRGKKMYRFGESSRCVMDCLKCKLKDCIYKCKGVPREYRRQFFDDGYVQFKKMLGYREGLARGVSVGEIVDYKKKDRANRLNAPLS